MDEVLSFATCRKRLHERINRFDAESRALRHQDLQRLIDGPVVPGKALLTLLYDLLFTIAYPADKTTLRLAERLLRKICGILRKHPGIRHTRHVNTGLPYARIVTRFSHDGLHALLDQPRNVHVDLHDIQGATIADLLQHTLPAPERGYAQSGLTGLALLDDLGVPPDARVSWLVHEAAKLGSMPGVKDHLFDQLGLYVSLTPLRDPFTLAYNRIPAQELFYHADRLRRFDTRELAHTPMPHAVELSDAERDELIGVIRNAMALLARETDPSTYLDPGSLRLYRLDRGLSIAFFTMHAERQLPYESYVGYTVFKNGLPVSYGGAWIFGDRAQFGINIFPPYRGGESAYVMGQLLRGYLQLFHIHHVEIDPYQFGLDNPEGIATGAFWFYYRFGFRPMDEKLCRRADTTFAKMNSDPAFTCPVSTLEAFTGSPLAMSFDPPASIPVTDVIEGVSAMIRTRFRGNRVSAVAECRAALADRLGDAASANTLAYPAFTEMALWAASANLYDADDLRVWPEVIRLRSIDPYAYQAAVRPLTMKQS
jgi:hypothetical protein